MELEGRRGQTGPRDGGLSEAGGVESHGEGRSMTDQGGAIWKRKPGRASEQMDHGEGEVARSQD